MTEYRYVIQHKDSSCLYLSESGPIPKPMEFLKQLNDEGFRFAEERRFGESMLRILTRDILTGTSSGKTVVRDALTGRSYISE